MLGVLRGLCVGVGPAQPWTWSRRQWELFILVLGDVLASPWWEISGLPVNAALRQFLEPHKADGCDPGGVYGSSSQPGAPCLVQ